MGADVDTDSSVGCGGCSISVGGPSALALVGVLGGGVVVGGQASSSWVLSLLCGGTYALGASSDVILARLTWWFSCLIHYRSLCGSCPFWTTTHVWWLTMTSQVYLVV